MVGRWLAIVLGSLLVLTRLPILAGGAFGTYASFGVFLIVASWLGQGGPYAPLVAVFALVGMATVAAIILVCLAVVTGSVLSVFWFVQWAFDGGERETLLLRSGLTMVVIYGALMMILLLNDYHQWWWLLPFFVMEGAAHMGMRWMVGRSVPAPSLETPTPRA